MSDADLRSLFLLRDGLVFLNHGSFGACPRPVHDVYQQLQRELEANPVAFLAEDRGLAGRMAAARARLATYVGSRPDGLAFVPNATFGVNVVARSLDLAPGDEVLVTDHAYGAVDRTWTFACETAGARVVRAAIDLPVESLREVIDAIWSRVTDRTRLVCIDHITSPTALVMPVAGLVARARRAGIPVLVDGAHGPGQLDLDLESLGADFYVGNCHKWLLAPKGAGFLWARPDAADLLRPQVISWGWRAADPGPSRFIDEQERQGTRDPSAMLSVPAAIDFMAAHDWPGQRRRCRALVCRARARAAELTGLAPVCPDDDQWLAQMVTMPLPRCHPVRLKQALLERHAIEIPVIRWGDRTFVRLSVQAYNTEADVDTLMMALATLLDDPDVFGAAAEAAWRT
jgi:isopenicillin-N epimerase